MTPTGEERYVIRGGQAGYDRLQVLARERWPDTRNLLHRAGVVPGMRALDLGCGGGAVTLELARMVSPGGSVVGVDMDTVKLELARRDATDRRVGNVEFRPMNAHDWSEVEAYDLVFSRFLLQHLRAPSDLLRRMWAAVRAGGLLVVEDADFGGCCCDPPNEAFDFYVRTYGRVLEHHGGDPNAGRALPRLFREAGIPEPQLGMVQRVHLDGEGKTLALRTLEATVEPIVESGAATREEVNTALSILGAYTADPRTLICGPRIFQLWVRRPT